jgi:hypothetical protein
LRRVSCNCGRTVGSGALDFLGEGEAREILELVTSRHRSSLAAGVGQRDRQQTSKEKSPRGSPGLAVSWPACGHAVSLAACRVIPGTLEERPRPAILPSRGSGPTRRHSCAFGWLRKAPRPAGSKRSATSKGPPPDTDRQTFLWPFYCCAAGDLAKLFGHRQRQPPVVLSARPGKHSEAATNPRGRVQSEPDGADCWARARRGSCTTDC